MSAAGTTSAKAVITQAANAHGIPPALLWGVFGTETGFGADDKTSSAGAEGDLQLEPSTARSLGVKNPNNFVEAANGAAKYLAEFKGRGVGGMLSAYNAGPAGGYQAGYVNETLQNAKSYGADDNLSVARETPAAGTPAIPGRTETTTSANPHAKGLAQLEALIASEPSAEDNPLLSTGVLGKAAAPITTTRNIPGVPASPSAVPAAAPTASAEAAGLRLPGAAPAPSVAAQAIHAPALPKAVASAKAALEQAQHHPVSVPQLTTDLSRAEGEGRQLVTNAPVVAETHAGNVHKTPAGPIFVPNQKGQLHG
jgi:hypothetical protein